MAPIAVITVPIPIDPGIPKHSKHHLIQMPKTFLQHLSLQPLIESNNTCPSLVSDRLFSFKDSTYIDFINSSMFSEPVLDFKKSANDSLSI